MRYQQQRRSPHVPGRSVTASDDTWRIEMKCAFPGATTTGCCSCFIIVFYCLSVNKVVYNVHFRNRLMICLGQ